MRGFSFYFIYLFTEFHLLTQIRSCWVLLSFRLCFLVRARVLPRVRDMVFSRRSLMLPAGAASFSGHFSSVFAVGCSGFTPKFAASLFGVRGGVPKGERAIGPRGNAPHGGRRGVLPPPSSSS